MERMRDSENLWQMGITRCNARLIPKRRSKSRVQVAERWILAGLRNETFFTLAALNARIAELLTDLNDRPMKAVRRCLGARSSSDSIDRR